MAASKLTTYCGYICTAMVFGNLLKEKTPACSSDKAFTKCIPDRRSSFAHGTELVDSSFTLEVDRLVSLTEYLEWKNIMFITDSTEDYIPISNWSATLEELFETNRKYVINVIVFCVETCIETTIQQVDEYDKKYKHGSLIWMKWSWLIVPRSTWSRDPHKWLRETTVSNLAVYMPERRAPNACCVVCASIHSLLWKSEGRQLSLVGHFGVGKKRNDYFGDVIFPNMNYGFNGRRLTFVTKEWNYFIFRTASNGTSTWVGSYVDILNYIQNRLNFTYIVIESPDDLFGVEDQNGSWNGVLGMVSRKEATAGWLPFEITAQRARNFDFSAPTDYLSTTFVYLPPSADDTWMMFFRPLSWQVLNCFAVSAFMVSILLFLVEMTCPNPEAGERHGIVWTLSCVWKCVHFTLGAMLNNAPSETWSTVTSRLIVGSWCLVVVVTTAAYSSMLVAELSVTKRLATFQTLDDVVSQEEYTWGTLGFGSTHVILSESNLSVYKKAKDGLDRFVQNDPTVLSQDIKVHYEKVRREKYVFLGVMDVIELWANRDCRLLVGKQTLQQSLFSPVFRKDSPITDYFSKKIEELRAHGMIDMWNKRWMEVKSKCSTVQTEPVVISLAHIEGLLYLLASGVILSFLSLISEMYLGSRCRQRKKNLQMV